jgi:serine protease Do
MSHLRSSRMSQFALLAMVLAAFTWGATVWQKPTTAQEKVAIDEGAANQALSISRAFRKAANVALPTVVTIETSSKGRVATGNDGENPLEGTPFEDFFKDQLPGRKNQAPGKGRMSTPRREGMGSGVIIDKSGIILTNNHVVEGAEKVTVRLSDGREFQATDIKTDKETDLAVVRINGAGSLPAAKMGDSDQLEIGDWVIAVGNPFGLDLTVSAGIISGKGRELGVGKRTRFLQTDAAINPGNSGGPLMNLHGEIVGINTAIASNSGGYQGVGFAIPINLAKWVTDQLVKSGSVKRAYLGVGIEEVSADLAQKFGVERKGGVLVTDVHPGTPAAAAGFHAGDVVTHFAGKAVHGPRDLQELVEQTPLDSKQTVTVFRDGKSKELQVVVKPLPGDFAANVRSRGPAATAESESEGFHSKDVGLEVTDLTSDTAEKLGFKGMKGVVVSSVDEDSVAAQHGLREGMLILKVGNQPVQTVEQFKSAMSKESVEKGILMLVRTSAGNKFLVLKQQ